MPKSLLPKTFCGVTDLDTGALFMARVRWIMAFVSFWFLIGRSLEIVPKYVFFENTMEQISPLWTWPWIICINEMVASYVQVRAVQLKSRFMLLVCPAWTATLATTFFAMWMMLLSLTIHVANYDKWPLFSCLLIVDIILLFRVVMAIYELFLSRALWLKWKSEENAFLSECENGSVDSAEEIKKERF